MLYDEVGTVAGTLGTALLGVVGAPKTATSNSTGGAETRPRNYAVNYIIKT